MADRYTALLDNFLLEIETISDSLGKAIARHEIPFTDGALLEDMGQKAREVSIRCYFYKDTYVDHIALLERLKNREYLELSHPKYGLMNGCIERISVRHDDREQTAEIDITFIENLSIASDPGRWPDVDSEVEDAYQTAITEQKEEFAADMRGALGAEAATILGVSLDPDTGILGQITGISSAARSYVKTVDTFVGTLEEQLSDIAQPAGTLIAAIEFGTTLPGRVIGAVARTAERYSRLYKNLKDAPERFLDSYGDGMTALENAIGGDFNFNKHVRIASASRAALDLGYMFAADEETRRTARSLEAGAAFDVLGRYVKPAASPVLLNVNQIEKSLALVNADIQAAVDAARGMTTLKTMARTLIDHARQVKIEYEKLTDIVVADETPLHLLCAQRGLPYQYAERLTSVNTIAAPNMVKGPVRIYVR